MGDAPEQQGTDGDLDHGLGDIDAGFVVAHKAAPSRHPAEVALYHPTSANRLGTSAIVFPSYSQMRQRVARLTCHPQLLDGHSPIMASSFQFADREAILAERLLGKGQQMRMMREEKNLS